MKIVICGGGICGCSVAYFLLQQKSSFPNLDVTIVERSEIAGAASGNAGGFLAKTWCDHFEVGLLARKGFNLHDELGKKFAEIDYRRLTTVSITATEGSMNFPSDSLEDIPEWIDSKIVSTASTISSSSDTAQVHPRKLTKKLFDVSVERGAVLVKDIVVGIEQNETQVTGVKLESGQTLPCDIVVIALGPWSGQASEWFSSLPKITGQRAHSIVLKNPEEVTISPHAIFLDYKNHAKQTLSPEIYTRPDNTIYTCGMSDNEPLPMNPEEVQVKADSIASLQYTVGKISPAFSTQELLAAQACYLPLSPDGLPLIGEIPKTKGAFIATGHSCWGILNGPITGKALAQLILNGKSTVVDLKPFSPERFL